MDMGNYSVSELGVLGSCEAAAGAEKINAKQFRLGILHFLRRHRSDDDAIRVGSGSCVVGWGGCERCRGGRGAIRTNSGDSL